jgi:oligogalacturonide lyase
MKTQFIIIFIGSLIMTSVTTAQIGQRFPSERKIVTDSVTGTELIFLTSSPVGDSKIYPTHPQWTADGKWVIFRSNRVEGEAMAVNEETGELVQVTEGGYSGMLNIAQNSMKLYYMRNTGEIVERDDRKNRSLEIIETDLAQLFADSSAGKMKSAESYQRVVGVTPEEIGAGGDMALDAGEKWVYFRIGKEEAAEHLDPEVVIEEDFGPRNMGAGPGGIAKMNIKTGEIEHVVSVPFQVGHIQSNPWKPGEIVFSWETGGKSPQRTWTVMADGSGLRPLYPEADYEWVTHEAIISKDEVAMAIMGHREVDVEEQPLEEPTTSTAVRDPENPGQETSWGPSGTREKPTGLAIVNLRTREMIIAGQTSKGSGLWHVHGSPDGRWAVGDDFSRSLYLIDRNNREMKMLTTGHKQTAADHLHPTFKPDGTKILIQSAMLSENGHAMNIVIVPVPKEWLNRTYSNKI